MDTDTQPPEPESLHSTAIPIAQISPDDDGLQKSSIHSVVTLLWPYSSSTRSLSVLLAEPDFRLRRSKGQVKVFFHGHVAEEVARTHVGIGDTVYLSLAGSRLASNDSAIQTPGRGVSWDVHFEASAFLEVWRDSKLLSTVKADRVSTTPPPAEIIAATPIKPVPNNNSTPLTKPVGSASWQSPAFLGKSRVSFGFTDPAIDPFVEDDGYVPGKGRKRPRFSMRSSEWRVVDEPESPRDKDLPEDWMAIFDEELANGSDAGEEAAHDNNAEGTAVPPAAEMPEIVSVIDTDVDMTDAAPEEPAQAPDQATNSTNPQFLRPSSAARSVPELQLPTDTPRLHPISSPGLPDPSPLATKANTPQGYFPSSLDAAPAPEAAAPLITASEETSEPGDSNTPLQDQPDDEPSHTDEADAVTVYTDEMRVLPDSVPNSSDAISSPQAPRATMGHTRIQENIDRSVSEEDSNSEADDAENASGSEEGSESELSMRDSRTGQSSSKQEEHATPKEPSEHQAREAEDDSGVDSAASEKDENVENEISETSVQKKQWPTEHELFPWNERHDYGSNESHLIDESDEDEPNPAIFYEADLPRGPFSPSERDSESESYDELDEESDDEEEPAPQPKPQNAEPEVIVLDSDSEDEAPAPQPADIVKPEVEEGSDEFSYDSEEEPRSGDYINDEAGSEDDEAEAEEEEDYDYARGKTHGVEEEPENMEEDEDEDEDEEEEEEEEENFVRGKEQTVEEEPERMDEDDKPENEGEAGDQANVNEQPERMDEDIRDKDQATHDHEKIQAQLHSDTAETPAEPALITEQSLETYDYTAPQEPDVEEFQAVTDYPQPNHESLEYLATISESAERLPALPEPTQTGFDMAIDPNLYELETPRENNVPAPVADMDEGEEHLAENNNQASPEFTGNVPQSHLALQLDGAAPPATLFVSTDLQLPIRHEAGQLITPGPSQPVETDQVSEQSESLNAMPATPSLTQDTSVKLEVQEPPQLLAEEAQENRSPTPDALVKVEDDFIVSQSREREPRTPVRSPIVVVDAPLDEDQQLQASIEVDDQPETPIDDSGSLIDRHYPGLRSKLSYFAPLATLIDHYNAVVDTISIATEIAPPVKANSGSKDFIMTLQLTDQSMAGTTVYAQILRPYKPALPAVQEGDAVLLRNFRVKSFDHSVILTSDSTSAWAVFSPSSEEPEIAGPPVELGSEEKTFATDLRQWYLENGSAMVADNLLQASVGLESRAETPTSSAAPSDAGSIDLALRQARGDTSSSRGSRRRKSHRRITIHELRDGRRYTEVGSSPGDGSIHELRDGTVYANL